MGRFHSIFVCSSCGYKSIGQMGRCPECGEWNSFVEEVEERESKGRGAGGGRGSQKLKNPVTIGEIKEESVERTSSGFAEVNRVLGGGMVAGSVILIAGEPGVGKSTLLLQIAKELTEAKGNRGDKGSSGNTILYVSGEESEGQLAIRFQRLNSDNSETVGQWNGEIVKRKNINIRENPPHQNKFGAGQAALAIPARQRPEPQAMAGGRVNPERQKKSNENKPTDINHQTSDNLLILNETNVDFIIKNIEKTKPSLIIVDSIQTIFTPDLSGTAGSVGQVRECAYRISNVAKKLNIPLFLVGQITKEGAIAGPKVLEHLVDVVLYFEGERFQNLRILRVTKNRFGPVDEAGIFEMGDAGLREVSNPSELFIGRPTSPLDDARGYARGGKQGAVIMCTLEGTRPLLAEIQALTVFTTNFNPRRVFSGLDFNRCQLILAILQKYLHIDFSKLDVYVSVSGGLKISEPAADLAIALALISSVKGIVFDAVCFGEIGLLGDVRRVNNMSQREKEAKRLGFKKVLCAENLKNIKEVLRNTN